MKIYSHCIEKLSDGFLSLFCRFGREVCDGVFGKTRGGAVGIKFRSFLAANISAGKNGY